MGQVDKNSASLWWMCSANEKAEQMAIDQWEARRGRGDISIPGLRFITPGPCLAARHYKISKLVDAKIAMRGRMMHNNRKMGCIYSGIWNHYNNIWRFLSLFIRCCIITAWQRITTSITSYRLFGFVSSGWPQLPPHPGECRCRAWWPGHRVSSGPDPVLRWDVSKQELKG